MRNHKKHSSIAGSLLLLAVVAKGVVVCIALLFFLSAVLTVLWPGSNDGTSLGIVAWVGVYLVSIVAGVWWACRTRRRETGDLPVHAGAGWSSHLPQPNGGSDVDCWGSEARGPAEWRVRRRGLNGIELLDDQGKMRLRLRARGLLLDRKGIPVHVPGSDDEYYVVNMGRFLRSRYRVFRNDQVVAEMHSNWLGTRVSASFPGQAELCCDYGWFGGAMDIYEGAAVAACLRITWGLRVQARLVTRESEFENLDHLIVFCLLFHGWTNHG